MSSKRERALEQLGDQMIAGLAPSDAFPAEPFHSPDQGWSDSYSGVRRSIGAVEWDSKPKFRDDQTKANNEMTITLGTLAITDTRHILEPTVNFIVANYLGEAGSVADILQRSRDLLSVAKLDETDEKFLFDELFKIKPDQRDGRNGTRKFIGLEQPLNWYRKRSGELAVGWAPEVDQWINAHEAKAGGCPAPDIHTERNGKKVSYIHAFWDTLIERVYGSYEPELVAQDPATIEVLNPVDRKELRAEQQNFRDFVTKFAEATAENPIASKSYQLVDFDSPIVPMDQVVFSVEDVSYDGVDEQQHQINVFFEGDEIIEYCLFDGGDSLVVTVAGDHFLDTDDRKQAATLRKLRETLANALAQPTL